MVKSLHSELNMVKCTFAIKIIFSNTPVSYNISRIKKQCICGQSQLQETLTKRTEKFSIQGDL